MNHRHCYNGTDISTCTLDYVFGFGMNNDMYKLFEGAVIQLMIDIGICINISILDLNMSSR